MSCSPSSRTVVCHEIFDENSLPSEEEIKDYAVKIGIDPKSEPHLISLACDGLMQALPAEWKPCYDEELQGYYYYNTKTNQSQWEHPLDEVYRNLVKKSRSESVSSAGDEDSKTSAKEDLKSFEEAVTSETLSKTMDTFKSSLASGEKLSKKSVSQGLPLRNSTKLTPILSPLSEERPPSILFNVKKEKKLIKPQEKHPRGVKRAELTLSGGGSNFLRKNSASVTTPPEEVEESSVLPQVKVVITSPAAGEEETYPKSILRDKSPTKLWDVDPRDMSSEEKTLWRKQELEEERKSVRFKLEEELQINFHVPDDNDDLDDVDEVEEAEGAIGEWNSDDEIREEEEMISKMKALAAKDTTTIQEEEEDEEEEEEEDRIVVGPPIHRSRSLIVKLNEVAWAEPSDQDKSRDQCDIKEEDPSINPVINRPVVEPLASEITAESLEKKREILHQEMRKAIEAESEILLREQHENIAKLKEEHARVLQKVKNELLQEEENQELRIMLEMKKRLDEFEVSIKQEEEDKKKDLREAFNQALKELEDELNSMKEESTKRMEIEKENFQDSFSIELEKLLSKEKEDNEKELQLNLQKLRDEMNEQAHKEIEDLKEHLELESKTKLKAIEHEFKKEMEEIERERVRSLEEKKKLESLELDKVKESNSALENLKREMAENLENEKQKLIAEHADIINKLKEEHNNSMEILLMDFKIEEENLRKEQQENLTRLKERLNSDHEAEVRKLRELIDRRNKYLEEQEKQAKQEMAKIEQENSKCEQLQRQVELLSLKLRDGKRMLEETRAAKPDDRVFEKLRCEKRILEDKYKTLKEKYIKMKSEIKSNAEKRAAKRNGESGKGGTGSETDKSTSQRMVPKGDNSLAPTSVSLEASSNGSNANKSMSNNRKQDVCIVTVGPTPTKEKVLFPCSEPPDVGSDVGEEVLSAGTENGLRPPATPKILPSSPLSPAGPGAGDLSSSITSPPEDSHTGGTASSSGTERPPRPAGFEPRRRKQFRLKSSSTSRLCKGRDMSPVENLRKQLKKLEDLEDLFPVTTHTDMYLRYPFSDSGQFGSSELEFFRHRVHLERDSVRRAKEFLRQQRQAFQRRQRELRQKQHQDQLQIHQQNPKSQMEMLHNSIGKEERELTDMEVSLHRTRSLLGEKIIRLRHLEQSLQRASLASACAAAAAEGDTQTTDGHVKRTTAIPPHMERQAGGANDTTLSDLSSHSGSSGFSSTELGTEPPGSHFMGRANINDGQARNYQESSAIVQSLEILNSEIRSIWEVLSKQHGLGNIKMGPPQLVLNPPPMGWPTISNAQSLRPPLSEQLQTFRTQQHLGIGRGNPSRPTSLAERTQSLRTWLRQARMDASAARVSGGQGSL